MFAYFLTVFETFLKNLTFIQTVIHTSKNEIINEKK